VRSTPRSLTLKPVLTSLLKPILTPWLLLIITCALCALTNTACSGSAGSMGANVPRGKLPAAPLEGRTPTSVVAFAPDDAPRDAAELYPMLSDEGMYGERWDVLIYGEDYELRVKFDVTNIGLDKLKGKARGYFERFETRDGARSLVEEYKIGGTFKQGEWSVEPTDFTLKMGAQTLSGAPGAFHLEGEAEKDGKKLKFAYDIQGEAWRPGSGWVLFGDTNKLFYKISHMATLADATGTLTRDDGTVQKTQGTAIGFHQSTNIGPQDMVDRNLYFRKISDDRRLMIEWRYLPTTAAYQNQAFGYLVVAYDGQVIFSSTDIKLDTISSWTDPAHYGYTIPSLIRVTARTAASVASFSFKPEGEPRADDPLASLSKMERFVASQIAQPMEYEFKGRWRLDLDLKGERATIQADDTFSVQSYR
jgi:hypothetical protein